MIGEGVQEILVVPAEVRAPDVEEPDGAAHGGECHGLGLLVAAPRVPSPQAGGDPGLGRDPP